MATAVSSRFAVLSIDVDDDFLTRKKQSKKKEDAKVKPAIAQPKANDPKKKNTKNKKKTDGSNQQQSQSNGAKPKKNNNTQKNKVKKPAEFSDEQWEEWKKKDQEFVSDSYEQDLHEAVLQSKLEFEQQRKLMAVIEAGQPPGGKGSRKRSKPQTMSLEQFNNPKKEEEPPEIDKQEVVCEQDTLFFEKVNEAAQQALDLELRKEQARLREPFIQEAITIAQYQDILEKRDEEIASLKLEVERLQVELQQVRKRNSKLCTILAQGEMKDKIGVLLEVERLEAVRQELSNEVQSLYGQLEQERSKVHALTAAADSKKNKGKKKTVSESGQ